MLPERSLKEPSELVIWAATSLLAVLTGLGSAFFLWYALHDTRAPRVMQGAVLSLSLGLVLIGLGLQRPLTRVFLVLLAASLALAFALGGPAFSRLGL